MACLSGLVVYRVPLHRLWRDGIILTVRRRADMVRE